MPITKAALFEYAFIGSYADPEGEANTRFIMEWSFSLFNNLFCYLNKESPPLFTRVTI